MVKKLKQKLILTSGFIFFLLFISSFKVISATTLFQDDFENPNNNQWDLVVNPGAWLMQNIQNSNRFGTLNPGIEAEADAGDINWTNYEFSIDILPISGTDRNLMFRVNNQRTFPFNLNLPVAYGIHLYPNHIWLQKFTVSGIQEPVNTNINLPNNQTTRIRVVANQNNIKIYLGNNTQPTIDWSDNNNPILQGKIGLLVTGGSQVWFDNVLVTDIALPSLTVPDIKQYSSPWNSQIYDKASSWSTDPTVARWGCALTSADMILQYYGFSINPGDLNTWLNSQPDGYVGNGLLNWLAISRYSKTNATTQPSLEFLRQPNTNSSLVNELNSSRPAILEVPGHFVVATGQTPTSFNINDPAYPDHPTLDSYGNSFQSLETYVPSHTDLGYIMLTIDPSFALKVSDTNGNEITGNTFIQNPLLDDVNNSNKSGNPLQIFMSPKPIDGNYKVEITGNGTYELGSYLYDHDGKVNLTKTRGIISDNQNDEFQVSIGESNITTQNITIDSILLDWADAKAQNKIKNQGIYNEIKIALNFTKNLIQNKNLKLAKISLKSIISLLKIYTPKFIDSNTSNIIQSEIESLI